MQHFGCLDYRILQSGYLLSNYDIREAFTRRALYYIVHEYADSCDIAMFEFDRRGESNFPTFSKLGSTFYLLSRKNALSTKTATAKATVTTAIFTAFHANTRTL